MFPSAIIICGASSSGKTSLARALQELLLPSIWLTFSVDDVIYSLPQSVLHRCNHENNWEGVDGDAIFEGAMGSLKALLQAGNKVIFDVIVNNMKNANRILSSLSGVETFTVELTCGLSILEFRASCRGDRTLEETRRCYLSSCAHTEPNLVLDSSEHTSAELASSVVAAIRNFHQSEA